MTEEQAPAADFVLDHGAAEPAGPIPTRSGHGPFRSAGDMNNGRTPAGEQYRPRGLAACLWYVLFRPQRVFGKAFYGRWDRRAMAFAMLVAVLVPVVRQLLAATLAPALSNVLSPMMLVSLFPARMETVEFLRVLVFSPIMVAIGLTAYATVLHVLLWMAQGAERGFAVTLQCVCYAFGCNLLAILPGNGAYVAAIWWVGVLSVGIRLSHGTRWNRVLPVMALHVSAVAWCISIAAGWVVLF